MSKVKKLTKKFDMLLKEVGEEIQKAKGRIEKSKQNILSADQMFKKYKEDEENTQAALSLEIEELDNITR